MTNFCEVQLTNSGFSQISIVLATPYWRGGLGLRPSYACPLRGFTPDALMSCFRRALKWDKLVAVRSDFSGYTARGFGVGGVAGGVGCASCMTMLPV